MAVLDNTFASNHNLEGDKTNMLKMSLSGHLEVQEVCQAVAVSRYTEQGVQVADSN